ncbi:Hypothetical protein R9X50_00564400 [Acrodontium crateriforme]|uniref:Uncharacterized protein n=1 Tax=Acrodontium crateriforme TaxID=150365 RepID=A0AAQ3RB18_9PEZI|nr:Hypothetical protein R9X50_00564400 [Acrodontium crateriforme]
MSTAGELQALLRFLSKDAKVPLASAMGQVKALQAKDLTTIEKLAKAKQEDMLSLFPEEKMAKQIIAAAKRATKKRGAGETDNATASTPAKKKRKEGGLFAQDVVSPAELEASLSLPESSATEDELASVVLFTNRAPLVLAFALTLLKYTMPEQPLSSRLSLAQGYVSTTSRARGVNLGIVSGKSAEEEGFGEGQPIVNVMGKELRVLRRWGYQWRSQREEGTEDTSQTKKLEEMNQEDKEQEEQNGMNEQPALWALDLEALKKANTIGPVVADTTSGNHGNLPIYTPQSARAYILKSFDSAPASGSDSSKGKKLSAASKAEEKERNLGKLLHALDLLYSSWAETIGPDELNKRTWGWYVKVRPDVPNGVAGWGGKNEVKLADILNLRRTVTLLGHTM